MGEDSPAPPGRPNADRSGATTDRRPPQHRRPQHLCQSGARAATAAEKLGRAGLTDIAVLEGGMNAWVAADAPVPGGGVEPRAPGTAGRRRHRGLERAGERAGARLRFVAGAVGLGLVTAAVADTCGLAMLLAKLPWNRSRATDIDAEIDAAVARLRG